MRGERNPVEFARPKKWRNSRFDNIDSSGGTHEGNQGWCWWASRFAAATAASAQNEQYIPMLSYRVGPSAAGGSGYYGGAIDYWTLVNMTAASTA